MARSRNARRLLDRPRLDRDLLRLSHQVPSPRPSRLEHGRGLWLYCGGIQSRDEVEVVLTF